MSAPAIFKAFVIRSFFQKRLSCLCFGMSCFKNLPACSAGSGFRSSDTGIMERLKSFTHCCPNCKTLPPFPDRLPPAALPGSMRRSRSQCGEIFYKYTRDCHCQESSASAYACYQICIRKVFLLIIWSGPYKIVQGIFLDPLFRCKSPQPPCTSRYCFSPTVSSSYRLKSSRKFSTSSRISDPAPEIPGS